VTKCCLLVECLIRALIVLFSSVTCLFVLCCMFLYHFHDEIKTFLLLVCIKVGIVISHGKAMTLQDKLQMTTSNSARRSPTSGRSGPADREAAVGPLRQHNVATMPSSVPRRCKPPRRHPKPVAKRSLMMSPKVRLPPTLSEKITQSDTNYTRPYASPQWRGSVVK